MINKKSTYNNICGGNDPFNRNYPSWVGVISQFHKEIEWRAKNPQLSAQSTRKIHSTGYPKMSEKFTVTRCCYNNDEISNVGCAWLDTSESCAVRSATKFCSGVGSHRACTRTHPHNAWRCGCAPLQLCACTCLCECLRNKPTGNQITEKARLTRLLICFFFQISELTHADTGHFLARNFFLMVQP